MVAASLNPPPIGDLTEVLSSFRTVFTVEAHYIVGGLGSLVSEVVAEHRLDCRVIRRGVQAISDGISGSQHYLQHMHNLSSEMLVDAIRHEMQYSEGIV